MVNGKWKQRAFHLPLTIYYLLNFILRLSALEDFSNAVNFSCGAINPARDVYFFITPATPILPALCSALLSSLFPLRLTFFAPILDDVLINFDWFFLTRGRLFRFDGRPRLSVIRFPLAACSWLARLIFRRNNRRLFRLVWNGGARLLRCGRRCWRLNHFIAARILRRRRWRSRVGRNNYISIPVNTDCESRRNSDADRSQNDQSEQCRTPPKRLRSAAPGVIAVMHLMSFLIRERDDGTRRQGRLGVKVRRRKWLVRACSGLNNDFSSLCHSRFQ
jgi:hypothetical protein